MDEERPTLAQLKALRVVDLRERLASLGLDTKGKWIFIMYDWQNCPLNDREKPGVEENLEKCEHKQTILNI